MVTPVATLTGTATITLTVSDGTATATDTFTLTVNTVLPSNTAPTITDTTNRTINEDTNTGAVAFTVGDAETAAGSLTVTGSSSNTTLVPNSAIVFGGSGASRTVTVTPAANQTGSATITVTVSDGALTASDSFTLTVSAVNDAPTITDITNRTINENANTGAVAFTVGDAETTAGSLTVTGSSSNTTLVPNSAIVLGGSGASRTVTVTPAANQNGSATITITVSDGTASTSDTFTLTVSSVNTAPTITDITNRTINEDANTGAVAFTVGDVETAAGSLTVTGSSSNTTLVPNSAIVFGGSGASRTVTVTPAANQNGSATITVTVSDGTASTSDTFTLTVSAVNDAPTISNVANQTIAQDTATSALAFTISDRETGASSLTLAGSSSNTALVSNTGIVFGGSGGNRTVTITPAAGANGTATITLTVSDGAATATDTITLTVTAVAQSTPPAVAITSPTPSASIATGSILPIVVSLTGDTSQLARVEFYDGATKIGESTAAPYTFIWTVSTAGAHSLSARAVNNDGASSSSPVVALDVTPGAQLVNLSTRGRVSASEPMITGLVLTGNGRQRVLLRAVGKTLESFGVTDTVEQPLISLVRPGSDTVIVETTDGWDAGGDLPALIAAMTSTGAFPLVTGSRDAAVLVDLDPGIYTAVIRDGSRKGGICLVEAYIVEDGVTTTSSTMVNLSTRGAVGRNDSIMIAGLVITGTEPKRVLVRGIGPTLGALGVTGALADPMLTIYAAGNSSTPVATNDDWDDTSTGATDVAAANTVSGAFPLPAGSNDSALVITLAPGTYTVQLTPARSTGTGTGLVEVYTLP